MPTGTADESMTAYDYTDFDGSGGTVASTFPDSLGGITALSGQVYETYYDIQVVNLKIQGIMESAQLFADSLADFTTGVDAAVDAVDTLVGSVSDADDSAYGILSSVSGGMGIVTTVMTAVFAVFIAFGVLGILGAIMMTFCDKYSCRYLVYFVCVVLFFLGLVCFILAIMFSAITPLFYYSCDFLQYSV